MTCIWKDCIRVCVGDVLLPWQCTSVHFTSSDFSHCVSEHSENKVALGARSQIPCHLPPGTSRCDGWCLKLYPVTVTLWESDLASLSLIICGKMAELSAFQVSRGYQGLWSRCTGRVFTVLNYTLDFHKPSQPEILGRM